MIGAYQERVKYKDKRRDKLLKRDTSDFYSRWISAEDEIDRLKDENRRLKDQIARLKIERNKNE
ncbi:hypothetical protein J2Z60_000189 [Lactobacillus colini]|uniref:Transposase n=1 Tax=Lactobacillus colini TaxID=1819254 RepID=A0ABS4MBH3_9LACO|nr:hypothetical protein [Lactobacillus colini]MBP2057027.1 hypothetical protein [Lactobacillus colini]